MISGTVVLEITRMKENSVKKAITHRMIVDILMKTPTLAIFAEIPHLHEV